jgi:hypothetical protein
MTKRQRKAAVPDDVWLRPLLAEMGTRAAEEAKALVSRLDVSAHTPEPNSPEHVWELLLRVVTPGYFSQRGPGAGRRRPKNTGYWHRWRLLDLALRAQMITRSCPEKRDGEIAEILEKIYRRPAEQIRQRLRKARVLLGWFEAYGVLEEGKQVVALLRERDA